MKPDEAAQILEALAQRIDPETGEVVSGSAVDSGEQPAPLHATH